MDHGTKSLRSLSDATYLPTATRACSQCLAIEKRHGSRHRWLSYHRFAFRQGLGGPEKRVEDVGQIGKDSDDSPEWRCDSMFDMKFSRLCNFYM